MPGQWLTTQVENNRALPSTGTAEQTQTIDLPRSNFLADVGFEIRATHATDIQLTLTRVRVIANGSTILVDLSGGALRGITKFETGRSGAHGGAGAGAIARWVGLIQFGRFIRDTMVICPAKIFKSLQLQLVFSGDATNTGGGIFVTATEYVSNDDPRSKLIRRLTTIVEETDVDASEQIRQKLPLGNFLRSVYLQVNDNDAVSGDEADTSLVRLLVNNGAEIPLAVRAFQLEALNEFTYRFDDGDTPDGVELSNLGEGGSAGEERMYKVDFDVEETLERILDTSRMNELVLETTANASASDDDLTVIVEEIIAVG